MMRVKKLRAKEILREEIAKFSSKIHFIMDIQRGGPRLDAKTIEWWRKDFIDIESATTDRNIAYLRAYRRIAGHNKLYAAGIPLADPGMIYMDRSVMRRLERDGYVQFVDGRDPYFEITPSGEILIAE